MTTKEFKVQYALGSLSIDDKVKLADNKRTSKEILSILSIDKSMTIREYVASNSNTPKDVLKKLSTDKYWYVRYWAAFNSSTPIEVLKILSKDEDSSVSWRATYKYEQKLRKEGK